MTNEPAAPASAIPSSAPKWWGHSMTIWGAVVTGLAAVLPVLAPAIGIEIGPDVVRTSADQLQAMMLAATGLAGTIAAIVGRLRATQPLAQRAVFLKI